MEFVDPTCKQLTKGGTRCHSSFTYQRQQRSQEPYRVALARDCSGYCATHCPKWIAQFLTQLPTHAYFVGRERQFAFTTAVIRSARPFEQDDVSGEEWFAHGDDMGRPHTATKVTLKRQEDGEWAVSGPRVSPTARKGETAKTTSSGHRACWALCLDRKPGGTPQGCVSQGMGMVMSPKSDWSQVHAAGRVTVSPFSLAISVVATISVSRRQPS